MARIASERLFLNADKDKVVLEGDPEARSLLASVGSEIPPEFVDLDVPSKFLAGKADKVDDTKAVAKPADKAVAKAANK